MHGDDQEPAESSGTTEAYAAAPQPAFYAVVGGRLVVPPSEEEMQEEIARFIQTNRVNDGGIAEEALRREHWRTAKLAMGVIGGNSYNINADGRDKTQIVLSRIRSAHVGTSAEAARGAWHPHDGQPT